MKTLKIFTSIMLFLSLSFCGFASTNSHEDAIDLRTNNTETLNSMIVVSVSYTFIYIGDDGCIKYFNVELTYDTSSHQIDYSESYVEDGCGHGTIISFYGWSNYITNSTGTEVYGTHLKSKDSKLNKLLTNPNFIKQFNASVAAHIK